MELPSPIPDSPPPKETVRPPTSLAARLLNVFATPGEVFDEVRASRSTVLNWLVPALISSLVGVLSAIVIFSQPAIVQKLHEAQQQGIEKQVQAGKLTRQQADQFESTMDKYFGPGTMKVFGSIGAVVSSFIRLFWWALVLWLFGRWFFKARFGYLKSVEVAGLSSMIAVLGTIVSLLLIVNLGKLYSSLSLSLAVSDFNPQNKNHLLLGTVNVFTFWQLGVLSCGLGRLAGAPFTRALVLLVTCWMLLVLLLVSSNLGSFLL